MARPAVASGLLVVVIMAALAAGEAADPRPAATVDVKIDLTFLNQPSLSEIQVVEGGILNGLIAAAAASLPVPAIVNEATMLWRTSWWPTSYNISITTEASPSEMTVEIAGLSPSGQLNSTYSDILVKHNCFGSGAFLVSLQIEFRNTSNWVEMLPLTLTYKKECSLDGGGGSLSTYPVCTKDRAEPYANARYGKIKVATFDVWGFSDSGTGSITSKADAVVSGIKAGEYDVVMLQQVFGSEARARLKTGLQGEYPYIVDYIQGDAVADSGLFFASKLKPRRCGFSQFRDSHGADSLQSKGIFSVLLDAGARYSFYMFGMHTQSGKTLEANTVRSAQITQVRSYLLEKLAPFLDAGILQGDAEHFGGPAFNGRMAIMMMGNVNVDGISYASDGTFASIGTPELTALLTNLGAPKDVYRDANPTTPGYTTNSYHVTCTTAQDNDMFKCNAGETTQSPGRRIDYMFGYDFVTVAGQVKEFNKIKIESAATVEFKDPAYSYIKAGGVTFPDLSYHKLVSATVDHDAPFNAAAGRGLPTVAAALVSLLAMVLAQW